MLSKEAIDEFKAIYRKEFGEEVSDAEAGELGESLISLFKVIYRPIPKGRRAMPFPEKNDTLSNLYRLLRVSPIDITIN